MAVAVLGRMRSLNAKAAWSICRLFKSMSLGKILVQSNGGKARQAGLSLHDLHHGFCCSQARGDLDEK